MVDAGQAGDLLGSNHATGGAGKSQLDRRLGGGFKRHLAAVRFDHGDTFVDALVGKARTKAGQMAADQRLDIGVR